MFNPSPPEKKQRRSSNVLQKEVGEIEDNIKNMFKEVADRLEPKFVDTCNYWFREGVVKLWNRIVVMPEPLNRFVIQTIVDELANSNPAKRSSNV